MRTEQADLVAVADEVRSSLATAIREIEAENGLRRMPVVVLTTSKDEEDIKRAYGLHANGSITKPADLDRFIEAVRQIERFRLALVALPTRSHVD